MEAHLEEVVKCLKEKGIEMGPKGREFEGFDFTSYYHILPIDIYDDYQIRQDKKVLHFHLASVGAPWDGCIELQSKRHIRPREECWLEKGWGLTYVKSWEQENRFDGVSQRGHTSLNVGPSLFRGCH
jgi:hypothetical protein